MFSFSEYSFPEKFMREYFAKVLLFSYTIIFRDPSYRSSGYGYKGYCGYGRRYGGYGKRYGGYGKRYGDTERDMVDTERDMEATEGDTGATDGNTGDMEKSMVARAVIMVGMAVDAAKGFG